MPNTSEKIYYLRNKNKLTQSELAAKLGVTQISVSKWEKGRSMPKSQASLLLAELFGVTIQSLMDDEQDLVYISEQSGGMDTIPDLAAMQNQIKELQTENSTLKDQIIKLQSQLLSEMQKKKD